MCDADIKKQSEESVFNLIKAAHAAERARILNIIRQERERLNPENGYEAAVFTELSFLLEKIGE